MSDDERVTEDGKGDAARQGHTESTDVPWLLAEVERLTGERDEWKRESELRGLPKELMQRLHRAEAEVGRLSGLVARYEKALTRIAEQPNRSVLVRNEYPYKIALAALREDGEAG